jgi:hypothetical protein
MMATIRYNGLDNRCGATTVGQKLNIVLSKRRPIVR